MGFLFGAALGADRANRLINDALDFIGVGVGMACPDVLNSALKHAASNSFLDEFREVAFFCSLGPKKSAQAQIGIFRDLDAPTNGLFVFWNDRTYALKQINTYTSSIGWPS